MLRGGTVEQMTPERWNELKHVLDRLLALEGESRAAYLCSLSDDVRRQAEDFLQASPEAFRELLPTEVGPDGKPEPQPEVLLGRYRIMRTLGRGGMGRVELAHDLVLDCPVAIKRLATRGSRTGKHDSGCCAKDAPSRCSITPRLRECGTCSRPRRPRW